MRLIGTAASGLRAQQVAIDTIGNNMANENTLGFKANQVDFAEALATETQSRNTKAGENAGTTPLDLGAGVIYNAIATDFQQGTLTPTDRALDLGIDGVGFFQVKTPDGSIGYTRVGDFQVDESGQFVDLQGNVVQPAISIPSGTTGLSVASNGEITGVTPGGPQVLGQISLATFQNPEGLVKSGNLFVPTVNSGAPQVGQPGSITVGKQVLGTIRGQSLEQSNVDMAASMTDLMQVQRAYQMNARLISDGDQMWGIANSIRR